MKREKGLSVFAYAIQLLLLITAIVLVVWFIPDLRKKPDDQETFTIGSSEQEWEETTGDSGTEAAGEEETENPPLEETSESPWETKEEKHKKPGKGTGYQPSVPETEPEPPYSPPAMIVASDLHYMSPAMTDYGEAFKIYTEGDDGKVIPYLDQITDAFLEEAAARNPSVLILSGDISQNGEKVNHGELARKLRKFQAKGIQVLVIPGNHDINHPDASTYYGSERVETEGVDADGFYEIYHEFGYDQAISRDENSLSYLYQVDGQYWLMMLDSCQYYPKNKVGGRIRKETLSWMKEQLIKAKEAGVTVIPVAHHNLLYQSALYPEDCTLENQKEVVALLEQYKIPVYISGHLHLQRIKKNVNSPTTEGIYGIHEIVSASMAIPPCQYGILKWTEDGSFSYQTKVIDVEAWAEKNQAEDENLMGFSAYSSRFLVDIISSQLFRSVHSIPKDRKQEMAELYGILNSAYCGGKPIKAHEIKKLKTYFYWERYLGNSKWFDRLTAILKDTGRDHNSLNLKAGVDYPAVEKTVPAKGQETKNE